MKQTKTQKMKGFTLVELLVVIAIIAVLAGIATPLILRAQKAGARTEALNNAKAIAGGLVSFKSDRGAYPCGYTRDALESDGFDNLPPGTDANAYLAQLIVTDVIDSEGYFYAAGVKGATKGDDIKGTPDKLLARGENCFAYIMTENEEPLNDVSSITPLVIAAIKTGGENPTFDASPYADKYVYGAVDGSGKVGDVGKNGEAKSKGRDSLFQSGTDSLFGDEIPVIKVPTGL
ncbi:MAG: prepilin-type N-terminal cleavage/methylation domain-containing protein [Akkermansiaceae bacterium]|jgi:prepilin-type N-terminal cleavage/methylation domain-containing protein|tara:strand:- start:103 stop:801 length:699 start_codon:yes stop_codon:yes gene_type:complete